MRRGIGQDAARIEELAGCGLAGLAYEVFEIELIREAEPRLLGMLREGTLARLAVKQCKNRGWQFFVTRMSASPAHRIEVIETGFDAQFTALKTAVDTREDDADVTDAIAALLARVDTGLAARDDLGVTEAFSAMEADLDVKKNDVRAARGRVRQVARLRRAHRRRQLREKDSRVAPRIAFYIFTVIGTIVFGIAIVLILIGNLAAALPLFPAAGAAWGLAGVMTWALRR
ncbi:hypothetical protein [Streptomyces sp. AC555_RSS877]|uniref:hypothetical protein n=1 Tax=Streptomyces sp. AC555_RSS877 TaxID=2823688 RepID=UPI001C2518F1|nr:hypothetical protein [Streptomyces sp. AC555_RSS877]